MRCTSLAPAALLLIHTSLGFPSKAHHHNRPTVSTCSKRLAQHYADAKSYRIKMTEERNQHS
jgi:hypothetical protein